VGASPFFPTHPQKKKSGLAMRDCPPAAASCFLHLKATMYYHYITGNFDRRKSLYIPTLNHKVIQGNVIRILQARIIIVPTIQFSYFSPNNYQQTSLYFTLA